MWLAMRMAKLGRIITEAIVLAYGRDAFLSRLAHPFWFQSFGAVMGMDWHSSGITTSVMGALKRGLEPIKADLGIFVCGGRGRHSRKTPAELVQVGERTGLDGDDLAVTSRLVAKIDSAALQDGFELYLHNFVVADDGKWTVVQQGMAGERGIARRYHWLSEGLQSFLDDPHAAIDGPHQGDVVNLSDARARASRDAQLALVDRGPDFVVRKLRPEPAPEATPLLPHLIMPAHHDVTAGDVVLRRLHGAIAAAASASPESFSDLLLTRGVGARTLLALAMVAEVVHGAPCRFSDPARFSMAHGGKDGHPFPVPLKIYDETIRVLKDAVDRAKLGNDERASAMKRLDRQVRAMERTGGLPRFEDFIRAERRRSPSYGGRTVFTKRPAARRNKGQLVLPGFEADKSNS